MQRLLTVQEACDRLQIGKTLAYELVAAGRIRTIRVGRCIRISEEALQEFIATSERDQNLR